MEGLASTAGPELRTSTATYVDLEWEMPPPPPRPPLAGHAWNKSISRAWRLRLHEAVRMMRVLDNIMWGNLARNLQDVTSDAQNYEGIASMYGISQAILYPHE